MKARFDKLLKGKMCLEKAMLIALLYHSGQKDKGGNSYIRHPLRVMEKMDSEDEMIVAVLHDTVEDTTLDFNDLTHFGCTEAQICAIDALTKREHEEYSERVERVAKSYVARKVKVEDIRDNMQLWRLKNKKLGERDMERMNNYIAALVRLGEIDKR